MPRLVIRKGEGAGKDYAVASPCVVGRHESAHFVLGDGLASRNHFRVVNEAGSWLVEDMGSTNGTLVNGQRVKRQALRDGDRIVAGTTELEFVQKDLLQAPTPLRPPLPAKPSAVAPARAAPAATAPALPAAPLPAPARAAAAPAAGALPPKPAPAPSAPVASTKPRAQAPIPTKKRR